MNTENLGQATEAVETPVNEVAPDVAATEATAPETEGEATEPAKAEGDEQFPRKAVNAISKRDKQIGKLRAEREALKREVEALRSRATDTTKVPKEDDFNQYTDYLKAQARHEAQQAVTENVLESKESQLKSLDVQERTTWEDERVNNAVETARSLKAQLPDLDKVYQENAHVFETFSDELGDMFLHLDNPALAMYNLVKDGKFDRLSGMPLHLAAFEIMQAHAKKPQASNPVSQAPKPISAAKGSGTGQKSVSEMSYQELVKSLG